MLRRALATLAVVLLCQLSFAQNSSKARHFTFHYSFTVKSVELGQPLQVWIPLVIPTSHRK